VRSSWLLRTLHEEHGVALDVLAQRFDRTVSWVSRHLSLVRTLPEAIQQHVHDGHLVAHAAMKYLVPLARANAGDCLRFTEAIAPHRLTTRQIGRLYQRYVAGPDVTREPDVQFVRLFDEDARRHYAECGTFTFVHSGTVVKEHDVIERAVIRIGTGNKCGSSGDDFHFTRIGNRWSLDSGIEGGFTTVTSVCGCGPR
jgi:hypothetical protein